MRYKVAVVGLRGNQPDQLRQRLGPDVQLIAIDARRALRIRRLQAHVVICTPFLGHSHQAHLESIVAAPVCVCFGGINSWAAEIRRRRPGFKDAA